MPNNKIFNLIIRKKLNYIFCFFIIFFFLVRIKGFEVYKLEKK